MSCTDSKLYMFILFDSASNFKVAYNYNYNCLLGATFEHNTLNQLLSVSVFKPWCDWREQLESKVAFLHLWELITD